LRRAASKEGVELRLEVAENLRELLLVAADRLQECLTASKLRAPDARHVGGIGLSDLFRKCQL
jgi:hypothetical protein